MSEKEITLAEALKTAGYRTGMIGKWHLGDYSRDPQYNPRRHGFDFYFGVPHSNDMRPFPLFRNEQEIEPDMGDNQARLTGLYTREAMKFIDDSKDKPFFLYLAHTFPHQPLFASERFSGKSKAGKYGDAVEEIDWSVGEIVDCLRRDGIEDNTLLIFTSDNGPWFEGNTGSLRGRKGQSYEGGFRVPFIARWPGRIPQGRVSAEPIMNLDLFPTLLTLAGVGSPKDRIIDGRDISGLLIGKADTVFPPDRSFSTTTIFWKGSALESGSFFERSIAIPGPSPWMRPRFPTVWAASNSASAGPFFTIWNRTRRRVITS